METLEIKVYAPVVIPTLCRYEHFKRCVESLSKCTGADKTELFIGLDYPAKDSHWDGYKKICDHVTSIRGFKEVHVFKRETNFGQGKNTRAILDIIRKKYDRFISSEDDNEFSPNFLEYVNKGLELYKDNPDVVAICGYSYPFDYCQNIEGYPFNAYPIHGFCAWGTGFWFEKRDYIRKIFVNSQKANEVIHSWKMVLKLMKKFEHITIHRLMFRYQKSWGDLMWRVYCALYNKYCIFPVKSKVRNLGFDSSGTNCANISLYSKQEIDENDYFIFDNIEIKNYPPIQTIQKKLYGGSWIERKEVEIEYILFKIIGIPISRTFFFKRISIRKTANLK